MNLAIKNVKFKKDFHFLSKSAINIVQREEPFSYRAKTLLSFIAVRFAVLFKNNFYFNTLRLAARAA